MKKLFVGVLWVALSLSVQGKEVNMTSPDGKYQFTLSDSGGQLLFFDLERKTDSKTFLIGNQCKCRMAGWS